MYDLAASLAANPAQALFLRPERLDTNSTHLPVVPGGAAAHQLRPDLYAHVFGEEASALIALDDDQRVTPGVGRGTE
jgi:hypothetical protein